MTGWGATGVGQGIGRLPAGCSGPLSSPPPPLPVPSRPWGLCPQTPGWVCRVRVGGGLARSSPRPWGTGLRPSAPAPHRPEWPCPRTPDGLEAFGGAGNCATSPPAGGRRTSGGRGIRGAAPPWGRGELRAKPPPAGSRRTVGGRGMRGVAPGGQRRRRWRAMAAAVPPATAPTPAAAGMPTFAALRAVR
ncbi:hypothetical protein FNV60_29525 [Streptomyces sp. RLB3-5]|nr:hypothetical protein FNV67_31810 [Streptomyces sp. S1D4-20]QDO51827.1 hypothetical protein FNV60_29525 [Streptomyces sp. RLB3-5]QDO62069.1 hypothetical protein FNV59_31770 [Streptomyces sp. RLB1-8]